jgi:hypothetical protein
VTWYDFYRRDTVSGTGTSAAWRDTYIGTYEGEDFVAALTACSVAHGEDANGLVGMWSPRNNPPVPGKSA